MDTTNQFELFEPLYREKNTTLPSGISVSFRETHGGDEGVLTKVSAATDHEAINDFLSGIVTEVEGVKVKLTSSDIAQWPSNDKYYLLIESRIHSLGNMLTFENTCKTCGTKAEYEEDLNHFLLSENDRAEKDKAEAKANGTPFKDEFEDFRPKRYPLGKKLKDIEIDLPSGKKVRVDILNSQSELKLIAVNPDERNSNHSLLVRNLRVYDSNKGIYLPLSIRDYYIFSSLDMAKIRKEVNAIDPEFRAITQCKCPNQHCDNRNNHVSVITLPDFFLPGVA